jgi:multiple sugar transport system permease protein
VASRGRLADREGFLAWAFVLPSVVYLTALVAVPFGLTVAYVFSGARGLGNLRTVTGSDAFWSSLVHTLVITGVSTVLLVIFGKLLACVLLADFRGRWLVRLAVLLPWTTPVALSALSWRWLLDSLYRPPAPYVSLGPGRADATLLTAVAVHVWRLTPLIAVIMMAGRAAVPRDLDDAARLDGAGFWRRTFEVTAPLTLPVDAVAAVFGAVITLGDMGVVRVLTAGVPGESRQVLPSLAYLQGVDDGRTGVGAAMALFLFPLFLAAVIVVLRAVRRLENL